MGQYDDSINVHKVCNNDSLRKMFKDSYFKVPEIISYSMFLLFALILITSCILY